MGENNKKINLLICTQKVDINDPILGFFHEWIKEFAKYCNKLTVICLEKGEYSLPENVQVLSLGKERGRSKIKYVLNFWKYLFQEIKNYDSVFVHMNKEYIFLGGVVWRILNKQINFWYNHIYGDLITRISGYLSDHIFYTSQYSFFSKWTKALQMPVGVNTELFNYDNFISRKKASLLYVGRISKVKNIDILIDVLNEIDKEGIDFHLNIVGGKKEGEEDYFEKIKEDSRFLVESGKIEFLGEVPNYELKQIYNENKIFINLTNSGSLDKTIFEAMACGISVLISNKNLEGDVPESCFFDEGNKNSLKQKLINFLKMSESEIKEVSNSLTDYVFKEHSLKKLVKNISINLF